MAERRLQVSWGVSVALLKSLFMGSGLWFLFDLKRSERDNQENIRR